MVTWVARPSLLEPQGPLSPYLEVTGVGPEADPAHVLQEYVQSVPCPACYLQCCLPIPLQRSLVLLKPQGQCCWPMFGSHHPQNCQQAHSILLPAPSEPGLLSTPKKGEIWAQEPPHKDSVWLLAPWLSPRLAWHSRTASRSHSPLEHCPRDWCAPIASPSAASRSHGHRCCGEERPAWQVLGHPRAAVCGTLQSHGPAGHSAVAQEGKWSWK